MGEVADMQIQGEAEGRLDWQGEFQGFPDEMDCPACSGDTDFECGTCGRGPREKQRANSKKKRVKHGVGKAERKYRGPSKQWKKHIKSKIK